ncbi:potassium-transporting ATPase subunit C [Comamonas serinivorans]|uniref:Potassium-transporting ATPase KdpC subunit n=1 Tax=Comamonas serinivorans TaxID=1082851 RepID=A0A1Y0ER40_9BURK|nr:potassium-transporting ATPase subunit KdpC [Comamonas serinivorans]ARU06046.1 potassium-transporting ATPase subunit C [Comamonas serinivorans]
MTMTSTLAAQAREASTATPAPVVADQGAWRGAIGLAVLTLAGFGFLYVLAGVGIGQALFPTTANGSLVERGGHVVGSTLVAQPFAGEGYFQPRPSAASYDLMALAGSNQARTNAAMRERIEGARAAIAQREGVAPAAVPGDLFTQSGGGIDPHISPEGAAVQVARVARERGLGRDVVEQLVAEHTEGRQLGLLGAPRVNVLALNLALDAAQGR